jgi:hypothetical protein
MHRSDDPHQRGKEFDVAPDLKELLDEEVTVAALPTSVDTPKTSKSRTCALIIRTQVRTFELW